MTDNKTTTRKLKKFTVFRQKINRKKEIILAILSNHTYVCEYPDPDTCPKYNTNTGLCIDCNVRCNYRKKFKKFIHQKNSKET